MRADRGNRALPDSVIIAISRRISIWKHIFDSICPLSFFSLARAHATAAVTAHAGNEPRTTIMRARLPLLTETSRILLPRATALPHTTLRSIISLACARQRASHRRNFAWIRPRAARGQRVQPSLFRRSRFSIPHRASYTRVVISYQLRIANSVIPRRDYYALHPLAPPPPLSPLCLAFGAPLHCARRALIDRTPASLINRMSLTWKTA